MGIFDKPSGGKSAVNYFDEGHLLMREGRLLEASERLREGLKLDPGVKKEWMNLGVMLKELKDYNESVNCLRHAIALDNDYGDAWFNLGSLYMRELGKNREALDCFEEAIRCNAEDEDAVCFAAEALQRLGRSGEAGNLLDKAIREHSNFKKALQMREQMASAFRKWLGDIAQGKSPNKNTGTNDLKNSYNEAISNSQWREVIGCGEKLAQISRDIGDREGEYNYLTGLGAAYLMLGDSKKAIEYYENALEIAKGIDDRKLENACYISLSTCYENLGDLKKAEEYYRLINR